MKLVKISVETFNSFSLQFVTLAMAQLPNYCHLQSKRLSPFQRSWIVRTSAFVSMRHLHSNVYRLVLGEFNHFFVTIGLNPLKMKLNNFIDSKQATTFNCEMSDLDQDKLQLDVHYTHTPGRDFWLFSWNQFDSTCRDKVATVGGSNRANNDRRMDIFREPDGKRNILQLCI